MHARELLEAAMSQVGGLTGLAVETVSEFERDGDETFRVTVEVRELERVPSTMDVLASYEVTLSKDGDLQGFRRVRRYPRAATEDGRR